MAKPVIPDVLAGRYASTAMTTIWSPANKIVAERQLWLAVLRAQAALGVTVPDGAIEAYQRVLTIEPRFLPHVVDDLLALRADQELLLEAVPRTYTLRLELARQLDRRGRWTAAWAAFEDSTTLAAMPAQKVEARIASLQPELVLGTQMERHIAKRLRIPCAVISAPVHVQDFPARYSPQMQDASRRLLGEYLEGLAHSTAA